MMSQKTSRASEVQQDPDDQGLAVPMNPAISRVERKRRETRARIIATAEQLMRTRPMEEVTIALLTEVADIGHGSFYLHFKSRNEVLVSIVSELAIDWDRRIQRETQAFSDPAEVLAYSARRMARAIAADDLWRWFIEHSGVPVEDMRNAIGRFGARDFGKGLMSGRLSVPELSIGTSFILGGFVLALLSSFTAADSGKAIDQMVEMLLRSIGIESEEAKEIAHRPMGTN